MTQPQECHVQGANIIEVGRWYLGATVFYAITMLFSYMLQPRPLFIKTYPIQAT